MHVIDSSGTWFIFNLNTMHCYSQITCERQYVHMHICIVTFLFVNPSLSPLLASSNPSYTICPLVYLLGDPSSFASGANTHPLLSLGGCSPLLLNPPRRHPTDQVTYLHRRHQQHQPSRRYTNIYICI
jgi:hypothetical protein